MCLPSTFICLSVCLSLQVTTGYSFHMTLVGVLSGGAVPSWVWGRSLQCPKSKPLLRPSKVDARHNSPQKGVKIATQFLH